MRRMVLEGRQFNLVCTDPPYHLESIVKRFGKAGSAPAQHGTDGRFSRLSQGFIGEKWDDGNIAFTVQLWRLVYELLLPGGFVFAFSSAKIGHRMATAMEAAGFVMHPLIGWLYGQGWPKAHAVAKGSDLWPGWYHGGQTLNPALEPVYVAQRPRSEKTNAANMDRHGTGAFNVESCRVPLNPNAKAKASGKSNRGKGSKIDPSPVNLRQGEGPGRWPSNMCHDGSEAVRAAFAPGSTVADNFNVFPPALYHKKANDADGAGSDHPTVKPVELLQWLIRLACVRGGHVLDPFAGTGTTAEAARIEGMHSTVIEAHPVYAQIIRQRFAKPSLKV